MSPLLLLVSCCLMCCVRGFSIGYEDGLLSLSLLHSRERRAAGSFNQPFAQSQASYAIQNPVGVLQRPFGRASNYPSPTVQSTFAIANPVPGSGRILSNSPLPMGRSSMIQQHSQQNVYQGQAFQNQQQPQHKMMRTFQPQQIQSMYNPASIQQRAMFNNGKGPQTQTVYILNADSSFQKSQTPVTTPKNPHAPPAKQISATQQKQLQKQQQHQQTIQQHKIKQTSVQQKQQQKQHIQQKNNMHQQQYNMQQQKLQNIQKQQIQHQQLLLQQRQQKLKQFQLQYQQQQHQQPKQRPQQVVKTVTPTAHQTQMATSAKQQVLQPQNIPAGIQQQVHIGIVDATKQATKYNIPKNVNQMTSAHSGYQQRAGFLQAQHSTSQYSPLGRQLLPQTGNRKMLYHHATNTEQASNTPNTNNLNPQLSQKSQTTKNRANQNAPQTNQNSRQVINQNPVDKEKQNSASMQSFKSGINPSFVQKQSGIRQQVYESTFRNAQNEVEQMQSFNHQENQNNQRQMSNQYNMNNPINQDQKRLLQPQGLFTNQHISMEPQSEREMTNMNQQRVFPQEREREYAQGGYLSNNGPRRNSGNPIPYDSQIGIKNKTFSQTNSVGVQNRGEILQTGPITNQHQTLINPIVPYSTNVNQQYQINQQMLLNEQMEDVFPPNFQLGRQQQQLYPESSQQQTYQAQTGGVLNQAMAQPGNQLDLLNEHLYYPQKKVKNEPRNLQTQQSYQLQGNLQLSRDNIQQSHMASSTNRQGYKSQVTNQEHISQNTQPIGQYKQRFPSHQGILKQQQDIHWGPEQPLPSNVYSQKQSVIQQQRPQSQQSLLQQQQSQQHNRQEQLQSHQQQQQQPQIQHNQQQQQSQQQQQQPQYQQQQQPQNQQQQQPQHQLQQQQQPHYQQLQNTQHKQQQQHQSHQQQQPQIQQQQLQHQQPKQQQQPQQQQQQPQHYQLPQQQHMQQQPQQQQHYLQPQQEYVIQVQHGTSQQTQGSGRSQTSSVGQDRIVDQYYSQNNKETPIARSSSLSPQGQRQQDQIIHQTKLQSNQHTPTNNYNTQTEYVSASRPSPVHQDSQNQQFLPANKPNLQPTQHVQYAMSEGRLPGVMLKNTQLPKSQTSGLQVPIGGPSFRQSLQVEVANLQNQWVSDQRGALIQQSNLGSRQQPVIHVIQHSDPNQMSRPRGRGPARVSLARAGATMVHADGFFDRTYIDRHGNTITQDGSDISVDRHA